jgi:phosphate transport system substrate-binding protein
VIKTARAFASGLASLLISTAAFAELEPRKHVHIVGSSTAYPIIAAAAEHFGRHREHPTPVVESTGTGGGIKLFCAGLGLHTPDITMASRSMKASERSACEKHSVTDIREIKIGFDGIVIASNRHAPAFNLSRRDIYLALARWVPSPERPGALVTNPYRTWQQIDPRLPDQKIRVYGPPPTSGTRDILVERLLTGACLDEPTMRELFQNDPNDFNQQCHALREDGAFINAGENDARLVRKLINDPDALGIFGFNFLDRNRDQLQAASIDGTQPSFETIESGVYPLSRPLYLYVKPRHGRIVAGLSEFVESIIDEGSLGPEGRLTEQGLIPLPTSP